MSNVSAACLFLLKTGIFCTFFLLLCSGVVLAADSDSPDTPHGLASDFDFNSQNQDDEPVVVIKPAGADILTEPLTIDALILIGYIEKIYISDTTVTIEANLTNLALSPTWSVTFVSLSDSLGGNNVVQMIPIRQLNSSIIQFDISPDNPGSYNVSLVYLSSVAQNIIITTEPFIQDFDVGINPDDPLLIYLSGSSLSLNNSILYLFSYDYQYFSSNSLNPNLLNELVGKNFIYFFDGANIRSIYWYGSNDSDVIQFSSESGQSGSTEPPVTPYKPVFYVNPFKELDLSLNHIFYCPIHDFYISGSSSPSASLEDCDSAIQWKVSMNGEEKDASLFLETSGEAVSRHFAFFNGRSLRGDSFPDSQELELKIYPILSQSVNFESSALPFSFKIKPDIFEKIITIPFEGSGISITTLDPEKPSLSSLSFSGTAGDKISEILSGSSVIVKTLSENEFSSISEIPSDVEIFTVIDIDFSQNKSVLNEYLSSTNQKAILTFKIPKIVNNAAINQNHLKIYHIVEVDGKNKLEELNIVQISEIEEPAGSNVWYYVISVETSGFSPFAVVSQVSGDDIFAPPVYSENSSLGFLNSAGTLQPNESDPSKNSKNEIGLPSQVIPNLVKKIKGHMSLFSVLVALMSGLFMWNYIHRKL